VGTLDQFYGDLDREVSRLHSLHGSRLHCSRGCSACCIDGLTVFTVEAQNIARHYAELLKHGEPHPAGACAFLDPKGNCRIYDHRPYVCRTQGLPLRWTEIPPDGSPVEMRDICPVNEAGPPIDELPPEACWSIGPFEMRLQKLQRASGGGRLRRTCLRRMFRRRQNARRPPPGVGPVQEKRNRRVLRP
jgi:hypothetical protein